MFDEGNADGADFIGCFRMTLLLSSEMTLRIAGSGNRVPNPFIAAIANSSFPLVDRSSFPFELAFEFVLFDSGCRAGGATVVAGSAAGALVETITGFEVEVDCLFLLT